MPYTGMQTIDWLYKNALSIDDEWSVRDGTGFDWWPHKHRQSVRVVGEEAGFPGEGAGYFICIKTDFIKNLDVTGDSMERINLLLMKFASMSGPVYDEETKTLSLCSMMRVHGEISVWAHSMLAAAAALQIHEAETMAHSLAAALNAEDGISGHPLNGMRKSPDEILGVAVKVFAPLGETPCRCEQAEFEHVVKNYMQQPPAVMANAGRQSFVVEFPHGDFTSLCRVKGTEPHPRYGNGLFLLHSFPYLAKSSEDGIRLALHLNEEELTRKPSGYGFGSYAFDDNCIHFTAFIPNALCLPGLLLNIYYSCSLRSSFASKIILPKQEHKVSVQNKKIGEDDADKRQSPRILFATTGRGPVHGADVSSRQLDSAFLEKNADLIVYAMEGCISPDKMDSLSKEIGYDMNPFFFPKKRRFAFGREILIAYTELTIIGVNLAFSAGEAEVLINSFISILRGSLFKKMELHDERFLYKCQSEMDSYLESFKSSGDISGFPDIFISNIGRGYFKNKDASKILYERFFDYFGFQKLFYASLKESARKEKEKLHKLNEDSRKGFSGVIDKNGAMKITGRYNPPPD